MIRHIVLWNFKEGLTDAQRQSYGPQVKAGLEALAEKIDGVVSLEVTISNVLSSSNRDVVLDSRFESEEALARYADHPEHVAVKQNILRQAVQDRICIDFVE